MSGDLGVIVAGAIGPFGGVQPAKLKRSIGTLIADITVEERHVDELKITTHPVEAGAAITDHAYQMPRELTVRCSWSNSTPKPANSVFGGVAGNLATALGNAAAGSVAAQLTSGAAKAIGGSAIGNLAVAQMSNTFGSSIVAASGSVNNGTGRGTTAVQDTYQLLLDLQSSRVPIDIYTGKCKYSSMLIRMITVETDIKTENSLQVVLQCQEVILAFVSVVNILQSTPDDQELPEDTAAVQETGTKLATPVNPDINSVLSNAINAFIAPYSALFATGQTVVEQAKGFLP